MPRGGARTGAGRKKNTPNKATIARQEAVAASGATPLDYMLAVMRDEGADPHIRFDAAKSAAPYVHPKLASVEHTGKDGGPIEVDVTDQQRARALAAFVAKTRTMGKP